MKRFTWAVVLIAISIAVGLAYGDAVEWFTPLVGSKHAVGLAYILFNFAVLVWILDRLLFGPLRARTRERHEHIASELERATSARAEAEALASESRARLDRISADTKTIMQAAQERAEAERARIIEAAEAEAERIRALAGTTAEREAAMRLREVEAEVIAHATEKAESVLRAQFTPADQQRLLDDYVAQIGRTPIGRAAEGQGS
jgi:F-type H+-transporting ATPase subunit b